MKPWPDFVVVGFGKCGTTTLHYILRQRNDFCMVPFKESRFFIDDGLYSQGSDFWSSVYKHNIDGLRGDITPSYAKSRKALERIAVCNPNMKIICMLRDPVLRAFSHYRHELRLLNVKDTFQRENIAKNNIFMSTSQYKSGVNDILELFNESNVLFMLFEQFYDNMPAGYASLCNFLNTTYSPVNLNFKKGAAVDPKVIVVDHNNIDQWKSTIPNLKTGDVIAGSEWDSDSGFVYRTIVTPDSTDKYEWAQNINRLAKIRLSEDEYNEVWQTNFSNDFLYLQNTLALPFADFWKGCSAII